MRTIRRSAAGGLAGLALVFGVLVGCGRAAPTAGPPAPPSGSPPASSATTSPAPAATTGTPPPTDTTTAPATTVVLSRVAYPWHWPNDDGHPDSVTHSYQVPPVPQLVRIGVGDHPGDPGDRPFNRMSFTFTTAFPSYRIEFVDRLIGDGNGQTIPLEGLGVLKVTFRQARAHTEDGNSSILSRPPAHIGYTRMVDYAQGGDFEGVLSYGIGITWPIPHSNPQIAVRAYEVEQVTGQGQHVYVVAIDVDATQPR